MKHLHTTIEIDATPQRVWQVLTDFAAFPQWNPFITKIQGKAEQGAKLSVTLQGMTIGPTVVKADANKELRWRGRLGMPGVFDGEHYFMLEEIAPGKTRFVHGERFTGVLVPVVGLVGVLKSTHMAFLEMNQALKDRAEAR
ncbi:MAG: SRPBCC domain-containing protein [SAR202 cluster bacterium]|nr:SRPBCC domain-containing protein [SAR202 cluster bacterium]